MTSIKYYIANSTGKLNKFEATIKATYAKATNTARELLSLGDIDIIFFAVEDDYQLGIWGYTPNAYTIQIYIDVGFDNFSPQILESTLLHEIHHAVRWQKPGFGKTLGEAIVTEGLATLFEKETTDKVPAYAEVKLKNDQIELVKKQLQSKDYDHNEWFYGTKDVDNWFGYSYGYKICRDYAKRVRKEASQLVNISAKEILQTSDD